MLGSVGSIVPMRWILGIAALGLIAIMVSTSANPWAGAATLPTTVSASVLTTTSVQVTWTAVDGGSTVPGGSPVIDSYKVDCVPTSGTTVTKTLPGITTATGDLTGLVANTAYVCSVSAISGSTLPSSGVAASSITTPETSAKQLGSVSRIPESASVAVGSSLNLSALALGADTDKTEVTGQTVNWTVGSGGSVSPASGASTTYTADSSGDTTVTATITQSSTNITKSVNIVINNFAPTPDPTAVPVSDPPVEDIPATPDVSDAPAGTADAAVLVPSSGSTTLSVTAASGATASVGFPANAVAGGTAAAVRTDIGETSGSTAALPGGTVAVGSEVLTVSLTDNDGAAITTQLQSSAEITITVPLDTVTGAGADVQGLTIYKASDAATGPWTKLGTTNTIVGSDVKASANVQNFSSFRLGFETRDIPASGGVLPSAGDSAPTATQALLLTGLGLALILGGGVYIRRQRRVTDNV